MQSRVKDRSSLPKHSGFNRALACAGLLLAFLCGSAAADEPPPPGGIDGTPTATPAPSPTPRPTPSPSPSPSPTPTPTAEQLRAALLDRTEKKLSEVIELDSEVARASGEQKSVLLEQQAMRASEAAALLNEALASIDAEKHSADDDAALGRLTSFLGQAQDWTTGQLEKSRIAIDELRGAREEATGDKLAAVLERLTQANDRYDQMLQASFRILEHRTSLGIPTGKEYEEFDGLLQQRAEERAGGIRLTRKRIEEFQRQVNANPQDSGPTNALLANDQALLEKRVQSLRTLSTLLDARGLPTAPYRQLIIEATGQVTVDIFDREVAKGLLGQLWAHFQVWLQDTAPIVGVNLAIASGIFFLFWLLGRLAERLVRHALERAVNPVSKLFQNFLLSMAHRTVVGIGILIALSQIGLEIGPLLAGLGVASFIVGFALQDSLSNFAAGMLILAYRPFDVGDVVNAGGVSGRVEAMTLVTTTILTFDNQRLIVPNSKIWGDVITNVTAERVRRVDLVFGISYSDDIAHAEDVLRNIVEEHPKTLDSPDPTIKLHELGDSSVNFIVRPWAMTTDYWDVYWDITREVKRRFDAEGISIPFPQRDIHMRSPKPDPKD